MVRRRKSGFIDVFVTDSNIFNLKLLEGTLGGWGLLEGGDPWRVVGTFFTTESRRHGSLRGTYLPRSHGDTVS